MLCLFPRRFSILENGADPVIVTLLNNFGRNGAKIVASSTARCPEGGKDFCIDTMCEAGINRLYIHDEVTTDPTMTRWDAIQHFLTSHPEFTDVIIFDDEAPSIGLLKFFTPAICTTRIQESMKTVVLSTDKSFNSLVSHHILTRSVFCLPI